MTIGPKGSPNNNNSGPAIAERRVVSHGDQL